MNTRPGIVLLVFGVVAQQMLLARTHAADEPDSDNARAAAALALAKESAASYRFRLASGGEAFNLQAEPTLKWTNPVRGSVFGDVLIWTSKGRPEVVATFVKWYHPHTHRTDEFHSLSLQPIIGERHGAVVWDPGAPGVELKPIEGAPEPATSPSRRLRQMRDLAQNFSGTEIDEKDSEHSLRLLSQPLYRYESRDDTLVDGALFALAVATDPEVFLLLEARKTEGSARWHYGLCRMTTCELKVSYRGAQVWTAAAMPHGDVYGHRKTYTKFSEY